MEKFNKVFAVGVDPDEYLLLQETVFEQSLQLSDSEIYTFNGKAKGNAWHSVGVDWLIIQGKTPTKKTDVAGWGATALAISEVIAEKFRAGLKDSCEFLPLSLNGEPWFALNILNKQNAIDDNLTEWNMRNGRINRVMRFKNLVINKKAITTGGLFRVEGAGLMTFCTDEPGGFYEVVKTNNLTGVDFAEVDVA